MRGTSRSRTERLRAVAVPLLVGAWILLVLALELAEAVAPDRFVGPPATVTAPPSDPVTRTPESCIAMPDGILVCDAP